MEAVENIEKQSTKLFLHNLNKNSLHQKITKSKKKMNVRQALKQR